MITHNLIQGSPEWHAYRAAHDNASDAPAMMGASPYKTRDQLIAERATGIVPEVDAATQRLFDSGHRFEVLARPLAEVIIGQELYPVTGSLEGTRLSASFDGLTLLEDVAFEHKRLNQRLRGAFAQIKEAVQTGVLVDGAHETHCAAQLLPEEYQIQLEQQCAVSGCGKILFMASDWADDDTLVEEMHCWYTPNLALRQAILAGWEQLQLDVAAYVQPEAKAAPVVAKPVAHLPVVLDMRAEGKLIACNLEQYKPAALAYIHAINTSLASDQEFADAEADAKFCRASADKLTLAIEQALGQMGDINAALFAVRDIAATFNAKGLELEKLVKARKEEIRGEIVAGGVAALREHIGQLNAAMPASYMPQVPADFGGAVKGKRTVESLRSAVNDELARAKIAASEIANRIHANLKTLQESGLVAHDTAALALKAPDDLAAVIAQRLAAEQARMDAERERIRQEEQAKAQRELLAQQARQARQAQADIAQAAQTGALHPATAGDLDDLASEQHASGLAQQAIQQAATLSSMPAPAKAASAPSDNGARINLSAINENLAPIKLDAAGLAALGFEPVATVKASKMYRASDMKVIRAALIEHLVNLPELETA